MKPNILLIYTGGTIGMIKDPDTGALRSFDFDELLLHIPEIRQLDCEIETHSFKSPIDSSNMNVEEWQRIGQHIHDNYSQYDGFVVLHGSDTMSYTGSALSFMFENLDKPIILTGSQLPIGDLRTDAKENLITSLQLASQVDDQARAVIKEVCIYFEYQLYRANRTSKVNAEHFEAFSSANFPALAISGVHLNIKKHLLWNKEDNIYAFAKAESEKVIPVEDIHKMRYRPLLVDDVVVIRLFPGMKESIISAIFSIPGLKGVIIETYGSGNAPTLKWFNTLLSNALEKGVRIVNVTQCHGGGVNMTKYDTGIHLLRLGVVSAHDMTTEAALAKMMYLLQHTSNYDSFKIYFETSLRGELTRQ
ncbi:MAG: asparaginase [Nonlabens sp.]